MSFSRFEQRKTLNNNNELYRKGMDDRGVSSIKHYTTPVLKTPSPGDMTKLDVEAVTWTVGERYWKIAERFYGNPEYWWVIAWFNKKPTEAHLTTGDLVYVPLPFEKILAMFEV